MDTVFFAEEIRKKNTYYGLRHGKSFANEIHMILSDPNDGIRRTHGLVRKGEGQVRTSAKNAQTQGILGFNTIIYSSPFSRCVRSAEIAREELEAQLDIIMDERLRERWFGDWEKTHNSNYNKVWENDKADPGNTFDNVESAIGVQKRVMDLIADLEKKYEGEKILLVSHGDVLQILQTGLQGKDASLHRALPHLGLGEIRKLNLE